MTLGELNSMVHQPAFWAGAAWMLINVACWKMGRFAVKASRTPIRVSE